GDLVLILGGLDEQDVGAGVAVATGPLDGADHPLDGPGVGAGDDDEIVRPAGGDGGADLRLHLRRRDDLLALHVTALLRGDLILDVDGGHAGALVLLHGADHVDRVAVAGIGVGDHRQVPGGDDSRGVLH